jgi:hypothetical protein
MYDDIQNRIDGCRARTHEFAGNRSGTPDHVGVITNSVH